MVGKEVAWHEVTNQGGRTHNEDAVGSCHIGDRHLFVLADGLGGHGKGEVASRIVVSTLIEEFQNHYDRDSFLEKSMQKAQLRLLKEQEEQNCKSEMKTTAVCLLIDGTYIRWAYAGDSRLYFWKNGRKRCRTLDHSVPQMLVLSRELKEKKIRFHEDRNRLLRVLGMEYDRQLFEISEPLIKNGRMQFLLCSDGFWEWIMERQMEKTLKKADTVEAWIKEMEQCVQKNGSGKGMDNYSAIGVWVE